MPFNGSGTFTIVNTFVPNTTILSAAVNQNFTDIATGLSDCLTRDGQAGMTAVFKAVSGSVSAPGISFNSDATAGLYLSSTGIIGLVAKSLGLLVNSAIYQATSATVQAGGSGYAVGDTITETGGTAINQAVFTVATLSGSAVATVTVGYPGNYTVVPSNPVAQGSTSGSGTGCTLNITFGAQFSKSVVTDESGAVPWQRLGASSFVSTIMAKANAFDYVKSLFTFGSGVAISNSTSPPTLTATVSPTLVPNYISGLTLSTAGGSGTFGIAAGVANDTTNAVLMRLASAYTKTTSSWAVGTGNGGLDTGAIANTTWYHVYLIERTDTGVVDVLFSLSVSSPTMPANYTLFRRIGSMKTDSSAHWILFSQLGNEFLWNVALADINTAVLATVPTLFPLTVPTGVKVNALVRGYMSNNSIGSGVLLNSPDESSVNFDSPAGNRSSQAPVSNVASGTIFTLNIRSDTSAQIRAVASGGSTTLVVATYGWVDLRGQA